MNVLLGTVAHNQHLQQTALALYEAGLLKAYYTAGVDNYRHPLMQAVRRRLGSQFPRLDRELARRQITTLPDDLIHHDWGWEELRTLASKLRLSEVTQDWLWEKSEHHLDRICSQLIQQPDFDVFIGTDYGCLATIQAAAALGKKTVVKYLSPHHSSLKKWVESEYERFPDLLTPETKKLMALAQARNARRDAEARQATIIQTNSSFTTQTLIDAGLDAAKIVTIPLGGAMPTSETALLPQADTIMRFVFAGLVSVHKGAHYLLEAWALLGATKAAELHFYGKPLLPDQYFKGLPGNVHFHGAVKQSQLFEAFQQGAILVFPTLMDGFGAVVLEAMARGLPVITTPNAGAADLIMEGRNGFLVPPKDASALAERLHWCLEHPAEVLAMRQAALATAQTHTWAHFREDFRRKLEQALGENLAGSA